MLLLVSQSVMAEWTLINENNDTKFYVDFHSYQKVDKNKIKIWELNDYPMGVNGIFSLKNLSEYDCKNKMRRTTYTITYSGNMGDGTSSSNDFNNGWLPVAPDTIGNQKLDDMCLMLKMKQTH